MILGAAVDSRLMKAMEVQDEILKSIPSVPLGGLGFRMV